MKIRLHSITPRTILVLNRKDGHWYVRTDGRKDPRYPFGYRKRFNAMHRTRLALHHFWHLLASAQYITTAGTEKRIPLAFGLWRNP